MGKEATEVYTMRYVSKELGVKSRTLRMYCNAGFVPGLRYTGRSRIFTSEQVNQLRKAVMLSRAGFTMKDLRKYGQLCQIDTPEARAERVAMLRTHKRQVWQELEDLQAAIDFLEREEEGLE